MFVNSFDSSLVGTYYLSIKNSLNNIVPPKKVYYQDFVIKFLDYKKIPMKLTAPSLTSKISELIELMPNDTNTYILPGA